MPEIIGFSKWRDFTIYEMKTKALISCAVTAQLVCAFFAYAISRFSHDVAHLSKGYPYAPINVFPQRESAGIPMGN